MKLVQLLDRRHFTFRIAFWDVLLGSLMMEAVRTSETSFDNNFTRQYNPEGNSEHHTRRRENLKSHKTFHVLTVATMKMTIFWDVSPCICT
jgi:hypothetical protein